MRFAGIAATALLAASVAGGALAQSSASATGSMGSMPQAATGAALPTSDYLTAAGQSDLFEIQEGRLAQTMGKSSQVKNFGRKMVTDHTKSTQEVVAAAMKSGLHPTPPVLRPNQQQMIAALQATSGDQFDSTYVRQQTQSHKEALQVQQDYAQGGANPNLKAAAVKIVPVVQQHLQMLQTMSSMMKS